MSVSELSNSEFMYQTGAVVWVQFDKEKPWWPARIINLKDVPEKLGRTISAKKVDSHNRIVQYFDPPLISPIQVVDLEDMKEYTGNMELLVFKRREYEPVIKAMYKANNWISKSGCLAQRSILVSPDSFMEETLRGFELSAKPEKN